jgi:hypothetical protein
MAEVVDVFLKNDFHGLNLLGAVPGLRCAEALTSRCDQQGAATLGTTQNGYIFLEPL